MEIHFAVVGYFKTTHYPAQSGWELDHVHHRAPLPRSNGTLRMHDEIERRAQRECPGGRLTATPHGRAFKVDFPAIAAMEYRSGPAT